MWEFVEEILSIILNIDFVLSRRQPITPCDGVLILRKYVSSDQDDYMMTSWNGNIFRVHGPLGGAKASNAELWCLLWSEPE